MLHMHLFLKIVSGMANSADPDQTAPSGAVWSGSALFAYVILSETLVFEFLGHLPYPNAVGRAISWPWPNDSIFMLILTLAPFLINVWPKIIKLDIHFLSNRYSNICYGLALLPSIICLGRLRIASKYIYNFWQLHQGVNSLAQWLEHWIFNREDRVRFPWQAWKFFQLCFIPLLRLSCRKTLQYHFVTYIAQSLVTVI